MPIKDPKGSEPDDEYKDAISKGGCYNIDGYIRSLIRMAFRLEADVFSSTTFGFRPVRRTNEIDRP